MSRQDRGIHNLSHPPSPFSCAGDIGGDNVCVPHTAECSSWLVPDTAPGGRVPGALGESSQHIRRRDWDVGRLYHSHPRSQPPPLQGQCVY